MRSAVAPSVVYPLPCSMSALPSPSASTEPNGWSPADARALRNVEGRGAAAPGRRLASPWSFILPGQSIAGKPVSARYQGSARFAVLAAFLVSAVA